MIKKLICFIYGHDWNVYKKFSFFERKGADLLCKRCNKEWFVNEDSSNAI